jgi:PadR family transcriptional regulator PadR
MAEDLENWKTQIRKGYLELCILSAIRYSGRLYGLELIDKLSTAGIPVKEGTLYPLLNRLTQDKLLASTWETEAAKGHPRKFYSLTKSGEKVLEEMKTEFDRMVETLREFEAENVKRLPGARRN